MVGLIRTHHERGVMENILDLLAKSATASIFLLLLIVVSSGGAKKFFAKVFILNLVFGIFLCYLYVRAGGQ